MDANQSGTRGLKRFREDGDVPQDLGGPTVKKSVKNILDRLTAASSYGNRSDQTVLAKTLQQALGEERYVVVLDILESIFRSDLLTKLTEKDISDAIEEAINTLRKTKVLSLETIYTWYELVKEKEVIDAGADLKNSVLFPLAALHVFRKKDHSSWERFIDQTTQEFLYLWDYKNVFEAQDFDRLVEYIILEDEEDTFKLKGVDFPSLKIAAGISSPQKLNRLANALEFVDPAALDLVVKLVSVLLTKSELVILQFILVSKDSFKLDVALNSMISTVEYTLQPLDTSIEDAFYEVAKSVPRKVFNFYMYTKIDRRFARAIDRRIRLQAFKIASERVPWEYKYKVFQEKVIEGDTDALGLMLRDTDFLFSIDSFSPNMRKVVFGLITLIEKMKTQDITIEAELIPLSSESQQLKYFFILPNGAKLYFGNKMNLSYLLILQAKSLRYFSTLSSSQKSALTTYAGSYDYKLINGYNRGQDILPLREKTSIYFRHLNDTDFINRVKSITLTIDSVLNCAPTFPFDIYAYRSINLEGYKKGEELSVEDALQDPTYKSCSLSLKTSVYFCRGKCLMMQVLIPKGSRVFKEFRRKASQLDPEFEIILPRKATFTPILPPGATLASLPPLEVFRGLDEDERYYTSVKFLRVIVNMPEDTCNSK